MVHIPILQSVFFIDIRFSDMDSQGHVHHEAIIGWIAHARVSFIDGVIEAARAKDIDYTLASIQVDFKTHVNFPGEARLDVLVGRVGGKSLSLKYMLSKDKMRFAQSRSVSVFFDKNAKDAVPIPDSMRKVLALEAV